MKCEETPGNAQVAQKADFDIRVRKHRKHQYHKVLDERKRPIRGLWVRNGRYYAQLTLEDEHTGQKSVRRVPLDKATTPAKARELLDRKSVV